jgi:hypothetical protein
MCIQFFSPHNDFPPPPYGATAPNGALVYLHETLRFTSVFLILDRR